MQREKIGQWIEQWERRRPSVGENFGQRVRARKLGTTEVVDVFATYYEEIGIDEYDCGGEEQDRELRGQSGVDGAVEDRNEPSKGWMTADASAVYETEDQAEYCNGPYQNSKVQDDGAPRPNFQPRLGKFEM
jgi:hypothetical protein